MDLMQEIEESKEDAAGVAAHGGQEKAQQEKAQQEKAEQKAEEEAEQKAEEEAKQKAEEEAKQKAQQELDDLEKSGKEISDSLTLTQPPKTFTEIEEGKDEKDEKGNVIKKIKRKQLTDEDKEKINNETEKAKTLMKEIKGTEQLVFNGRTVNRWGLGYGEGQGPPMVVNGNPNDLDPMSDENQNVGKLNRVGRGDSRVSVKEKGKYTYKDKDLEYDQAWARGDMVSPLDGRTRLRGWLFRKYFPKVDPSSPFREPLGGAPPPIIEDTGTISDETTDKTSNSGENILINLTESLKLNEISPARAAEHAIALLVGPIQRAMTDGSGQIELWKDDLYNAIDVPERGKGLFRDLIASQIYSLAASSIDLLTSSGCGDEENDPAVVAARAEAIKLALLRDKNFSDSVDNMTLNMQQSLVRGLIYLKNLGVNLLSYIPGFGPTAGIVINQVIAAIRQAISDIQGLGQVTDIAGTVAEITNIQRQGVCKALEEKVTGAVTGEATEGKAATGEATDGKGATEAATEDKGATGGAIGSQLHLDGSKGQKGGGDENVSDELMEESDKFKILTDTMINTLNSLKRTPEFTDAMTKAAIQIAESTNMLNSDENNYENYKNIKEKYENNLSGGYKKKHNKFTKKYIKKKHKKNKTKKGVLLKYKKHRNGEFYKIIKKKNN